MSLSFGETASQSSSAACRVGATADASVQRDEIARDDHEPAVAAALQGSEFHGSRLPGLKFFFNPLQQSM